MNLPENQNKINAFNRYNIYLALISVISLLLTFEISNADFTYSVKATVLAVIISVYLLFYAVICFRQWNQVEVSLIEEDSAAPFDSEIEGKLLALEEANQFFGASLKSADMFRLIASRTNEIIPYSACTLFLTDERCKKVKLAYAVGENFKDFIGSETDLQGDLAGNTLLTRRPQLRERYTTEKTSIAAAALQNFHSAIAVPLQKGEIVYGVFILYAEQPNAFDQSSLQTLEAVETRITPLLLSSRAFETSVSNALTDALTALPNERAFYMVLENQIAESLRFRDERPLTILTMDIKNFAEHNQRFGHATGDRLLLFAANKIKNQLRQMDFLARSSGDEFLAVLPTASETTTREIVERIEKTFVTDPFEATAQEKIHLQLSFGAASFGKDGETAEPLLKHAVLRKQQAKSIKKENNVLWFPKDYVN